VLEKAASVLPVAIDVEQKRPVTAELNIGIDEADGVKYL